jgi:hypothetical protein
MFLLLKFHPPLSRSFLRRLAAVGKALATIGAAFASLFADETAAKCGKTGAQATTILLLTDNNLLRLGVLHLRRRRSLLIIATSLLLWVAALLRIAAAI